ncbi:recombinase family protein [Clostridioides difficile]|uniref:recombinase family protein n=1 Tax=Clostridioides difficile TaxID=1496 RepID=UPI002358B8F9|nr:recombinase family protein [Clostridioides difficile]MDC9507558.1 recombinase family protein [Clostridioides difficile]
MHSLLNAVKRQEIDIILFWKMDRWFRSVSDFYKVQDVLDEYKVKWVAVAEPNMNMDTRDG